MTCKPLKAQKRTQENRTKPKHMHRPHSSDGHRGQDQGGLQKNSVCVTSLPFPNQKKIQEELKQIGENIFILCGGHVGFCYMNL